MAVDPRDILHLGQDGGSDEHMWNKLRLIRSKKL
jgi:hypothetical protein